MQTNSKTNGVIDAQAQRRLQGTLQKAQRAGFRAMKRFADACMESGRCGLAGSVYEGLGHNRKAANAYLEGGNLPELRRMVLEKKLILVSSRAKQAFEIAARQGNWREAEEWAKIIVQRRIFDLAGLETSGEAERMVAEARILSDRY